MDWVELKGAPNSDTLSASLSALTRAVGGPLTGWSSLRPRLSRPQWPIVMSIRPTTALQGSGEPSLAGEGLTNDLATLALATRCPGEGEGTPISARIPLAPCQSTLGMTHISQIANQYHSI